MGKTLNFLGFLLLFCAFAHAQIGNNGAIISPNSSLPITLEATCSGSGTTQWPSCGAWTPTTPSPGDAIDCNVTGVSGGNNVTGMAMDSIDGYYDIIWGLPHPSSTLSYVATTVFPNSVGGSITPQAYYSNPPTAESTIKCSAWKYAALSNILDGGAINQTQTATSTNPTSGTAASPSNPNAMVIAYMSRNSGTAPSSGGGCWLPSGTLTLVGTTNVRQASEYCPQTTATAENGPFTATGSVAYADSQFALLPLGNTNGYRSFTGIIAPFGASGSVPSGTMTAALLSAAGSTLSSINGPSPFWTLTGTAPTYDSTVNPTAPMKIMVNGITHTVGDAGVSMNTSGAATSSFFSGTDYLGPTSTPNWFTIFYRIASAGATIDNSCDILSLQGGVTDRQIIGQVQYTTGTNITFKMETVENAGSQLSATLSTDTDYMIQEHVAGVNERYHQLLFLGCGTANCNGATTWSLLSTLNLDHLCTNAAIGNCPTGGPTPAETPTGTASSGNTSLTISSGTGTVNGQLILDPTNNCYLWPTLVESGGGTTGIVTSQGPTCPISGTVNFYTVPANLSVATNCSGSANSLTLSCVLPGTGTITAGQAVGGNGIAPNATVITATGAGPVTVTLSNYNKTTIASGTGISFWSEGSGGHTIEFGKNAGGSCGITSTQWFSWPMYDPVDTYGAILPLL